MARQQAPTSAFKIEARWFGRDLKISLNRWLAAASMALLPLALSSGMGTIFYVAFHDQGLAALLTRQSDMEDAYEDRIAAMRSQIDEQAGSSDPQALDAAIRSADERASRLEVHLAMIEAQLREAGVGPAPVVGSRVATPADGDIHPAALPSAPSTTGLRLGDALAPLAPVRGPAAVASLDTRLAAIDARQAAVVKRLSDPLLAHIGQVRAALDETGLPPQRWSQGGVGGPFVPVSTTAQDFDIEQGVGILRDARSEAARLDAMALGVPLRKPLAGPVEVTSTFGVRLDPFYGRPALHTGIDMLAAYGTAIQATAAGTVTMAGPDGGYGNLVEIDHGHGIMTRYAHLSAIVVAVHQKVAAGDILGRVGSSGRATGPHLHYETRIDGEPVDPTRFLKAGAPLFAAASQP